MNEITRTETMFEDIKHIDEYGNEFWYARELMAILEYIKWQKFKEVIEKAKDTCKSSNYNGLEHFTSADKMIDIGSKTTREKRK